MSSRQGCPTDHTDDFTNCNCTWRRSVWIQKRKGSRDATGMLTSERTLEIDDKLSACLMDWQEHITV